MRAAALVVGLVLCFSAILDAFQTIILPRRPEGRFRITNFFYGATWAPWSAFAHNISNRKIREQIYSIYGPLSLLLLLVLWAFFLVAGFACLFFALGSPFSDTLAAPNHLAHLRTDLYV